MHRFQQVVFGTFLVLGVLVAHAQAAPTIQRTPVWEPESPGETTVVPIVQPYEIQYESVELWPEPGMPFYGPPLVDRLAGVVRRLSIFGGVHGFKGPTDLGRNGNFGFHEGLNFGAPLGDPWGHSYQVGFQAVHSNFVGNEQLGGGYLPSIGGADRNQIFFTIGFFRRAFGSGWQSGMVFDLFYDDYYQRTTLQQIRSETSLVLGDLSEIGYWGAYGIGRDTISGLGQFDGFLDPTDMFSVFYRRRFTGGGHGRIWVGLSGDGDLICGLDGSVPLGTSWALENNFTALFPKKPRGHQGLGEEAWSVSIQLVWYPGRSSRHVFHDPSHPLFYVADNSWFLVDRRNK